MNYRDLISRLAAKYETGEARAIVRMLLENRTNLSWTDILCGGVEALEPEKKEEIETLVSRLETGEPIQYVLGEADFYGRVFHVAKGVLIPRIETEELISEVMTAIEEMKSDARIKVLDIGTGSGCIAVTLALELEKAGIDYQVEALDISDDALHIASGNAERLSAKNISFRRVDLLNELQTSELPNDYTIIVSNPPYICNKERAEMEAHVLEHEPELALFVPDNDPLLFYRVITEFAVKHLKEKGKIFFEINRAYGKETAELLKKHGFIGVEVIKDQFANDRIASAQNT